MHFREDASMATLTIRGLDEATRAMLRVEAARHGRSMEAEVRSVLERHVAELASGGSAAAPGTGLASTIHSIFAAIGGADDLELPDRRDLPRAAEFGE
jgi:antitoxin FitA